MSTMANADSPLAFDERVRFIDGQLEALKWIALAFMFLDHFGRHLLGLGQDTWVFALGRIAFPLFALVLALNLAREGDRAARAARTTRRLTIWCAVAVLPSIWARGEPMLVNVLGTLALGAAACWALSSRASLWLRVASCIAIALASHYVEFGLTGVFLVAAIYHYRTQHEPAAALLAIVLLLATAWLNASFGGVSALAGTLASVPIAWAVRRLPVSMPRLQLAFYLVYPLHLALIGAWKTVS